LKEKSWLKKQLEIFQARLKDTPKIDWFPAFLLAFMCFMVGGFLGKPEIGLLNKLFAGTLVFMAIFVTFYASKLVEDSEEEASACMHVYGGIKFNLSLSVVRAIRGE